MGMWDKLNKLGEAFIARLPSLYASRNFPYEVRGLFAAWFEEQDWDFDEKLPENAIHASGLLSTFEHKFDCYCKDQKEDLMSQMRYFCIQKQFSETFGHNPQLFVATVREILNEEKLLLKRSTFKMNLSNNFDSASFGEMEMEAADKTTMEPSLKKLNEKVEAVDTLTKDCKNNQEQCVIDYQNLQKVGQEIQRLSALNGAGGARGQLEKIKQYKQEMEKVFNNKLQLCVSNRGEILKQLLSIQISTQSISIQVNMQLAQWRRRLQKSLSGAPPPEPLEEIQGWFESLSNTIWHFYSVASQYKLLYDTLPLGRSSNDSEQNEQLLKDIVNNFTSLIVQSFVVDKQPPQVMKTQAKFQASVRLLAGAKLNLQMSCPEVIVSILSESQCRELIHGKSLEEVGTCGQILNNKSVLKWNSDRSILKAEFENLQLKNIQRKDRKGQESVLEAKSALVFSAKLNIGGEEIPTTVLSFPVVVVVHGNQIPNSEATIFWDNMFCNPSREAFDVPDSVDCEELLSALNARWILSNERKLTDDNLLFLKEKLSTLADTDYCSRKITWAMFTKNQLIQGKTFTFWEWFFQANEVVKKFLKCYWTNHSLELFLSKDISEKKLLGKNIGTFLVRCSASDVGLVTIACCVDLNGKKGIWHFKPWGAKDFQIRSLADRIFDLPILTHLYPDIPKESIFGELRSKRDSNPDFESRGYVDTGIIACIRSASGEPLLDPSTPTGNFSQKVEQMDFATGYESSSPSSQLNPFFPDILCPEFGTLDSLSFLEPTTASMPNNDFLMYLNDFAGNQ